MAQNTSRSFTPTYNLTWRQLFNSWEKMAQSDTLPTVIDRSYLRWLPGSAQTGYLTLARQFGLVDEQYVPTDLLRRLTYEQESRAQIVNRILHEHYAPIIELGKKHSTAQQLMDLWKETYGQEGDTRRKAITFFMQAAEFSGIQVSPLWQSIAAASRQASRTSNVRRGKARIPRQKAQHESATATPTDTIYFAGGAGSLRISVDVDLLKLSTEDREFIIGIVDAIRSHQSHYRDTEETSEVSSSEDANENGS
jgi:hypothetical protein